MGLFLAKQHGYFAAEGLNVTIESIAASTAAVTEQLHGSIDVTAGAYTSYILAQAENPGAISWRILAEGSSSQPNSQQILVTKDSPILTLPDLKGKTVASNVLDSTGTLLIQSALAAHNVPLSPVKLVAVPFPDMAGALSRGEIDAAWFDEPFLSAAKLTIGAKELYDTSQGATADFPISGYMVTKSWAEKYPRTAAAFTRAINRGQTLADSSRADDEAAATRYIKGITPTIASALVFDSYPTSADAAGLQRVPDLMAQFGLLKKPFNMSAMTS
jgi:NitT/TauT family transport system substrate-binding protein